MPDLDDRNPYPEDEPRLRQAWEDGYRAKQEGRQAALRLDDPSDRTQAWLKGYKAARSPDTD